MIYQGHVLDVLKQIDDESVQCIVTSPPYWGLRDYGLEPQIWDDGWKGSLGLEPGFNLYIKHMVQIFREVKRVLRKDGTVWLNLGDSYCGYKGENYMKNPETSNLQHGSTVPKSHTIGTPQTSGLKPKDLIGIPWAVALALRDDGWYLRSDIIWAKGVSFCPTYSGSVMPESVRDRPTSAYEHVFLLAKSKRYFYDAEAAKEAATDAEYRTQGHYRPSLSTFCESETETDASWIIPDLSPGTYWLTAEIDYDNKQDDE